MSSGTLHSSQAIKRSTSAAAHNRRFTPSFPGTPRPRSSSPVPRSHQPHPLSRTVNTSASTSDPQPLTLPSALYPTPSTPVDHPSPASFREAQQPRGRRSSSNRRRTSASTLQLATPPSPTAVLLRYPRVQPPTRPDPPATLASPPQASQETTAQTPRYIPPHARQPPTRLRRSPSPHHNRPALRTVPEPRQPPRPRVHRVPREDRHSPPTPVPTTRRPAQPHPTWRNRRRHTRRQEESDPSRLTWTSPEEREGVRAQLDAHIRKIQFCSVLSFSNSFNIDSPNDAGIPDNKKDLFENDSIISHTTLDSDHLWSISWHEHLGEHFVYPSQRTQDWFEYKNYADYRANTAYPSYAFRPHRNQTNTDRHAFGNQIITLKWPFKRYYGLYEELYRLPLYNTKRPFYWLTDAHFYEETEATARFFKWLEKQQLGYPSRTVIKHREFEHLSPIANDPYCLCYCCGPDHCPVPHETLPTASQEEPRLSNEQIRELFTPHPTRFEEEVPVQAHNLQEIEQVLQRLRDEGQLQPAVDSDISSSKNTEFDEEIN